MGDGATACCTDDINSRYNSIKENTILNSLIKNTLETIVLGDASAFTNIGYGVLNDVADSYSSSNSERDLDSMITSFDLNVFEIESKNGKDYVIVPGKDTQLGIDKFNSQVENLRSDYIDNGKKIPLKGDALVDVLKIANENEFITLGVDEHLNFYVKDIQDVSAYDIINCPNKVNELYYVVNLLDN